MIPYVVPTGPDPFYRIRTDLDNVVYFMDFAFNVRESCWYVSLYDANEVALVEGKKLVCYTSLLPRYAENFPQGHLMVISSSTDDSPPGLFDLVPDTGRCSLVYFSPVVTS